MRLFKLFVILHGMVTLSACGDLIHSYESERSAWYSSPNDVNYYNDAWQYNAQPLNKASAKDALALQARRRREAELQAQNLRYRDRENTRNLRNRQLEENIRQQDHIENLRRQNEKYNQIQNDRALAERLQADENAKALHRLHEETARLVRQQSAEKAKQQQINSDRALAERLQAEENAQAMQRQRYQSVAEDAARVARERAAQRAKQQQIDSDRAFAERLQAEEYQKLDRPQDANSAPGGPNFN